MILSNVEIVRCLDEGLFTIQSLAGRDPTKAPFNTSAVDLRLSSELQIPTAHPHAIDLRMPGIANLLQATSARRTITPDQPYVLSKGTFVLAQTIEKVDFPIHEDESTQCYSARVEGKSSLARCGILIHFTAPTIHSGYHGPITLEIINLGPNNFLLAPEMYICQLIIEEVGGRPSDAPNQFRGQKDPAGVV